MIAFFNFIGVPLGWIMWFIYQYIPNYGVTLLLFTLLVKLIMLPMAISQQKGMAKMAIFNPKMQALQKKYAKNKQKLNEEMGKLYEKEGYNPLSSCLPMLIQMPIMFGLINVIYYPLTHILRLAEDLTAKAVELSGPILTSAGISYRDYTGEINALKAISIDTPAFVDALGQEFADTLLSFDFSLMGIFLGDTPTWNQPSILWLIPILSCLFAGLSSWQSSKVNKAATGGNAAANSSQTSVLLMSPLISLYISFLVPAGVGLYWLISNALTLIQSMVLNKLYNPAEMAEKARLAEEAEKEAARQARIAAKKAKGQKITEADLTADVDDDGDIEEDEPDYTGLSQKEINRLKLAAARKRDAERYGEEYIEVTDEDLK